jgi:NAD(P)-dependent dehydrogenase (short-subunit alcohol dehydrogenase family)
MLEFTDRVILITGASGGLGRAVCQAFLDAGAIVAGVSRSGGPPVAHTRFLPIPADLTAPEQAAAAVERARSHSGRLDALIHLVGGFAGGQPIEHTDDATWQRMLDLNLNAAFHALRAVLPVLRAAGQGRIVAVGSRTAVEPAARLSAYGVSKAALVALVRTCALELKATRITANAVLPGVIDTAANRAADPAADFSKWVAPQSIASLILWLASDAASDVNGAAIPIYGVG